MGRHILMRETQRGIVAITFFKSGFVFPSSSEFYQYDHYGSIFGNGRSLVMDCARHLRESSNNEQSTARRE